MLAATVLAAVLAPVALAQGPGTYSPLRPPAIPLAVRSPWMQTYLPVGTDVGNTPSVAGMPAADPGNNGALYGAWPQFWSNSNIGWVGAVTVDGSSALWMGNPLQWNSVTVTQVAFEYTATRSIFSFTYNNVGMNVTFLSGVYPSDLMRASFPNSYMEVEVWSLDGNEHSVQVYTDITGEWVSGLRDQEISWTYSGIPPSSTNVSPNVNPPSGPEVTERPVASSVLGTQTTAPVWPESTFATSVKSRRGEHKASPSQAGSMAREKHSTMSATNSSSSSGIAYHQVYLTVQQEFSNDAGTQAGYGGQAWVYASTNLPAEGFSQGDWGNWYYSTANTSGLTYQISDQNTVRTQFIQSGVLTDTVDGTSGTIDGPYPVFAYAYDFQNVTSQESILFMISHHQQHCVQFESGNNTESNVPCLWNSYFSSDEDAISFFYNDYETASEMATKLDDQIYNDSVAAGGEEYAAITALATRQAFGGLVFTNTPDQPWVFLEEISSDDNIQTIDVIFPFHPMALYLNATIIKYLLEPHFINIAAGNWAADYAPHDLGKIFPNATGYVNNVDAQEPQPIEESGNFLIMMLAYAQRTQDIDFLTTNYDILKQWTEYLIAGNNTIIPDNPQYDLSTDDFAGAATNQSNLAVKGIIGIGAMAQIANLTGNQADAQNYTAYAQNYIQEWIELANDTTASPPRMEFNYTEPGSWSLLYNIYADKELNLGLVPQSVFDQQSTFYASELPQNPYGLVLDTRPNSMQNMWSKVDWQMFAGAVATQDVLGSFTTAIFNWLGATPSFNAFPDLYNVQTGTTFTNPAFRARPVIGGVFAKLALNGAPSSPALS